MISQIIFFLCMAIAIYFIAKSVQRISSNIKLGTAKADIGNLSQGQRLQNMLLFAFGQKKMFKKPIPAIFHFIIYAGFLLINIEVLEILIDGATGSHRIFADLLGPIYAVAINFFELLAVGVIVACVIFLIRRNILKLKRFGSLEMKGWPKLDANLILYIEIVLMTALLLMNAADQQLQNLQAAHYPETDTFFISASLIPLIDGLDKQSLILLERSAWWFHLIGILLFANYIPFSKHLHIALAFPNTYYSKDTPMGKMNNMPAITNEVKIMLNLPDADQNMKGPEKFGAKDVTELSWKNLLDAYSCTECGRCTSNCPANLTGKKLSPRKIMMDTRDRAEELGKAKKKGEENNNALLGNYITEEEINACTTCNACVEACPVNINPLEIILELRRFKIMEEAKAPAEWNAMFSNMETNFAPWKFPASDRANWTQKI